MAFYHDHPDVLITPAAVRDSRPGTVLLAGSPFFPGGGGQLPDRGVLRWAGGEAEVTGFEQSDEGVWHLLGTHAEVAGTVELSVDSAFRALMRELHTATHILNAAVFLDFDGARTELHGTHVGPQVPLGCHWISP
jgi:misacylated tRNA(Ala) deacylase